MIDKNEAVIGFRRLPEIGLTTDHLQGDEKIPQKIIEIINENTEKTSKGFNGQNQSFCEEGASGSGTYRPSLDISIDTEGTVETVRCPHFQSYISSCEVTKKICTVLEVIGPKKMKSSGM